MIYYLIMIKQDKFRLICTSILKVKNFLIFRDFLDIVWFFYEFILNLKKKKFWLKSTLMWQPMRQSILHVATW